MTPDIYLDSNATNPVHAAAAQAAMLAMTIEFGNPSSTHPAGLRAKSLLEAVRLKARRVLGAGEGRVMFNSGATEGIHTAVLSALVALRERRARGEHVGRWLVCGATEHKAMAESLAHWNRLLGTGFELCTLPVDTEGRHDLAHLRALAPQAALVCTMAANNETGVVSDLGGIEAALAGSPTLWLVDCVQALGKLPLDLAATRIDYAPFSGHKLYALKGIGMLYVREGAPFTPLMVGGGQESGWRSGTENMPGVAALGAVLDRLDGNGLLRDPAEMAAMRERLAAALRAAFVGLVFNTPFERSLPTTLNFSVPDRESGELLELFGEAGVQVSAGSACSSGQDTGSHVLRAMQVAPWRNESAVRLSFGPLTEEPALAAACEAITRCGAILAARPRRPDHAIRDAEALVSFLRAHPLCTLVDLRDADEQAKGGDLRLAGQAVINVPMAQVPARAGRWLLEKDAPLVFVCRSGQRARQAAASMRDHGHAQAWHLAVGVAELAAPALAEG